MKSKNLDQPAQWVNDIVRCGAGPHLFERALHQIKVCHIIFGEEIWRPIAINEFFTYQVAETTPWLACVDRRYIPALFSLLSGQLDDSAR